MRVRSLVVLFAVLFAIVAIPSLGAPKLSERELPPGLIVPDAARPGPDFDVDRATRAYLDVLSTEQRAKSDAYFEGGYWIDFWSLVYTLAVAALLMFGRWSHRLREVAQRIGKGPWRTAMLYSVFYLVAVTLLQLPFTIYTGYIRERQYALSNQSLAGWARDAGVAFLIGLILFPILIAIIYAAVRKGGGRWWVWASGIAFVFLLFLTMIAPVAISPLFNKYTPLEPGRVRSEVLSLARANLIPADNVYVFNASKQTTRVSANVSGLFGTTRISLNDNLLERTSLPEIRAVLGHEMGHYVLNHGMRLVIYLTLVIVFALWVVHRLMEASLARWGQRWGVTSRGDPASLPAAIAILSLFFFLAAPLTNTITRQAEAEADAFGMNAAGEPHGFATVSLRLSTYRKIEPGPIEEFLFYDHPSGYDRVHRSMVWLKEHQDDPRVLKSLEEAAAKTGARNP